MFKWFRSSSSKLLLLLFYIAKINDIDLNQNKRYNRCSLIIAKLVNDRRVDLLGQLRSTEQAKQRTLTKQRDELESSLADLYTSCEFVEKALEHGSETEILLVKKQVGERLVEYGQMQVVTTPAENPYMLFQKGK
jgi:hypothetical protein